jgi:hypothetical protein
MGSAVVPSRGAAASVEVFCFFREEKKLVIIVLLMTLVLSTEKDAYKHKRPTIAKV